MSWLDRLTSVFVPKAAPEGAYRDGPWLTTDGVLPHAWGQYANFWQLGYNPIPTGGNAMVEACISAYAQTVAMCPFGHWLELDNGGRERIKTSALYRVMRKPNDYQTRSDFLLNLVRSLYFDGNAYALALRNERFEISSLHLMDPTRSRGTSIEGEIFYSLAGNSVIESRLEALGRDAVLDAVPARDVLHVRLHTKPDDPLRGFTPLEAAALAVASTNAAMAQSIRFYLNQSRPSGVLQTDLVLTKPQMAELRQSWDEQAKGLSAGGTPILQSGLKWNAITVSPKDTQLAEAMKLSDAQIAQVFRVPLSIVGSEAQPLGSTEATMNYWISTGLGFALNQVELAIDSTFKLDQTTNEYSELDSSVLLRSAFRDRIEGLVRGVQGGIFAINEAREFESMPAAEGGDEPRVQQQLVPLSFASAVPIPPAPANVDEPPAPVAEDEEDPGADKMSVTDWNRYFEGAS